MKNNTFINNPDNNTPKDEALIGNEKIENAITQLQTNPSEELLVHTLTMIRRQMQKQGQFIVAVNPSISSNDLQIQAIQTEDGKQWWSAFTSFDEELKGSSPLMSTFLADIQSLFLSALQVNEIEGIILNPWNKTIMLDKHFIQIILGNSVS